jgi:NAD+ kinase
VKVALQIHPTRIGDEMLARDVYPVLAELGCAHYQLPRRHQGAVELEPGTELILALGGDGTFLHGARVAALHEVPIFGVIVGRLGFLCSATLEDMGEALAAIVAGRMPLQERHVLSGQVLAGGEARCEEVALNDIVVFRAETEKLRDFEAYDNGELIARYRADGIILATALGSTAYNMSAGGPLVHPSMELIVLTPICAHSLFTKPLVLPPNDRIEIVGRENSYPLTVSFDGSSLWKLEEGDRVVASSFGKRLKIYRPERYDFYQVLRHKFQHGYVYGEDQA